MKNLAYALAWKYPTAGITTNGEKILWWRHPTIPKPPQTQYQSIIDDYEDYLQAEKTARKTRKKAVMTKLGLTQTNLKGLLELVEDRTDT